MAADCDDRTQERKIQLLFLLVRAERKRMSGLKGLTLNIKELSAAATGAYFLGFPGIFQ